MSINGESEGKPVASTGTDDDLPGCELRNIIVSTGCCIPWVWGSILTDMMAYVDEGDKKGRGCLVLCQWLRWPNSGGPSSFLV